MFNSKDFLTLLEDGSYSVDQIVDSFTNAINEAKKAYDDSAKRKEVERANDADDAAIVLNHFYKVHFGIDDFVTADTLIELGDTISGIKDFANSILSSKPKDKKVENGLDPIFNFLKDNNLV